MTPQLRFPEFTDQWNIKQFDDIFDRVTSKNKENNQNILTISAQRGLVSQNKFFSKLVASKDVTNYYLLHENDYTYNKSYSNGYPMGAIKRLVNDNKGVVSTLYICFSNTDTRSILFIDQYFEAGKLNTEIAKIAQEGARNHGLLNISVVDFFKLPLIVPSILEQQKIADYIGGIDSKLTSIQTKVAAMRKYKKGVTQALFSGKLRFKDGNGNPYPDWREKKLGELVKFHRGNLLSKADIDCNGKYKCVHYGELFTEYTEVIQDIKSRTNLDTKSISKSGDILMPTSDVTPQGLAKASVINEDGVMLGGDINILRPNDNISPIFLSYLMNLQKKKIMRLVAGATVRHVYSKDIAKIIYYVPTSTDEQQKIANFLTTIDDKIKLDEAKLASAKEFKKALLQRMFV